MTPGEEKELRKKVVREALRQGAKIDDLAKEYSVTRIAMWQFVRRWDLDEGRLKSQNDGYRSLHRSKADGVKSEVTLRLAKKYGVNA